MKQLIKKSALPRQVASQFAGQPPPPDAGQRPAGLDGDPRLGERSGCEALACFATIRRSKNEKRDKNHRGIVRHLGRIWRPGAWVF
jgi:hypothetical protein